MSSTRLRGQGRGSLQAAEMLAMPTEGPPKAGGWQGFRSGGVALAAQWARWGGVGREEPGACGGAARDLWDVHQMNSLQPCQ